MTKNDVFMTRARRVNPVPADSFMDLAWSPEVQETLNVIVQTPPLKADTKGAAQRQTLSRATQASSSRQHTLGLGGLAGKTIAIGAAVALVLGITAIDTTDRPAPNDNTVWAPELVSFAEGSPRLLIREEGWSVVAADEFGEETGSMVFATSPEGLSEDAGPGEYWMTLDWYPSEMHTGYVEDRRRGADGTWTLMIDGHEAVVFQHKGTAPTGMTFYAIWVDGSHSLELRTDIIPTANQFNDIAATAKAVDVDAWLSAMPPSVVTPKERNDAVDKILADIPVPSNVDVEELKNRETVNTSVTYEVTTAVVCGWIDQWIDAIKTEDGVAKKEAIEAMAGARQWAAFQARGQYESFVFDVADAMAAGSPVNGDSSLPTGVGYQRHIGCPEG